jgi:hypothetical protein
MASPHGQEAGKQAPLPFVQHGQDAVDRLVVESHATLRVILASGTTTLINGSAYCEVNHDRIPSSLKRILHPHNLAGFGL